MRIGWVSPDPDPPMGPIPLWRWGLVGLRGAALVALVFGGLMVLLLTRLVERPVYGDHRPWTPAITQWVCRNALRIMGIGLDPLGHPMPHHGALVANHSSWLDIFVLNACARVYFVSKAEVAGWAGIGWLARATGTVFIERKRTEAASQRNMLAERLDMGHKLLFFPEGTSSDGRRVLPFKSTLFEALISAGADDLWVQPVTVEYHAPPGRDPRLYGWWGEMEFASHFLWLLSVPRHGRVRVTFHAPIEITPQTTRKALAKQTGDAVADGFAISGQG